MLPTAVIEVFQCNMRSPKQDVPALVAHLRDQRIVVPDILRTIYNNPTIRLNDTEYLASHFEK
jgi:hypothetical protein